MTQFFCHTCKSETPMTTEEAKAHLREKHGITEIKGTQKAVSFLDGEGGWYQHTYDVKVGDVELVKIVTGGGKK